MQHAERRAARLADGGFAARQTERQQMRKAAVARGADTQEFTAPDAAIVTVTGAVPGHAEHRGFEFVVGHAGEHVRQMVRYTNGGCPAPFCKPRREVVW